MRRYRALLFLVLLLSLFLSGCVYYNTLYNAKKLYSAAQARPLANGKPNAQAIDEYTKAMKKCGYILTEYKNSRYADEALFLLAKCLYYKGNSNLQAYEKCQDFLKFYPKNKQAPEVILFKTFILHEMKKNDEAVTALQNFLLDPAYKKYYARAYLQLSIISMDEEAYAQTQYYLQKIIDNYPHSREYKYAFFQLGYAYHAEHKYVQSNQVFQELLKSRLEKQVKLDARYYIALNDYYLKNYKKVDSEIKPLLKAESRTDVIPLIQLLKARNLLGLNQNGNAVSLFESIIKNNARTLFSAEANYYLGEFYLNYLHDYDKAIISYNNVKTESFSSPFVEDALSKSAIASQIILYNKKDSNLANREMVNQQMKLAEYYLHNMNLPDSALSVYRGISVHRNILKTRIDSLELRIAYLDSLGVPADTSKVPVADSVSRKNAIAEKDSISARDSLKTEELKVQVPQVQPDSINLKPLNSTKTDPIEQVVNYVTNEDSLNIAQSSFQDSLGMIKKKHIDTPEVRDLVSKLILFSANLMEYDSEFVPLALFDQIWIYKYSLPDSVQMGLVYQELLDKYPLNQYTYAATMLFQGKEIKVTTEQEIAIEEKYIQAVDLYTSAPDSTKVLLKSIAEMQDSPYSDKSKFTLGYIYWFNEQDSMSAKPYFDELLKKKPDSDYSVYILQFYNGKNFVFTDELPAIKQMEERDRKKKEDEAANKLKQKELNVLNNHPLPKNEDPVYVLPPKPEKPKEKKDVDETNKIKEPKSIVNEKLLFDSNEITVDQPQPKGDDRLYDFMVPTSSLKH